jgi:hypothetical protein
VHVSGKHYQRYFLYDLFAGFELNHDERLRLIFCHLAEYILRFGFVKM